MSRHHLPGAGLALLFLTLLLQGCGFHLRGAEALPQNLSPLYISGLDRYDDFRTELRNLFSSASIEASDNAPGAAATLHILKRDSNRRTLSVDSSGKAVEYELYEAVRFSLTGSDGSELVPAQMVEVTQNYINTGQEVLGKAHEESGLRKDMHRDLADRMMRRIHAQLR